MEVKKSSSDDHLANQANELEASDALNVPYSLNTCQRPTMSKGLVIMGAKVGFAKKNCV
jgi:hypothetical protein